MCSTFREIPGAGVGPWRATGEWVFGAGIEYTAEYSVDTFAIKKIIVCHPFFFRNLFKKYSALNKIYAIYLSLSPYQEDYGPDRGFSGSFCVSTLFLRIPGKFWPY